MTIHIDGWEHDVHEWNGKPISAEKKVEWLRDILSSDINSVSSGDTLMCVIRDEDGTVDVYETRIVRKHYFEPKR